MYTNPSKRHNFDHENPLNELVILQVYEHETWHLPQTLTESDNLSIVTGSSLCRYEADYRLTSGRPRSFYENFCA